MPPLSMTFIRSDASALPSEERTDGYTSRLVYGLLEVGRRPRNVHIDGVQIARVLDLD